jgi:hypothetical protein
MTIDTKAQSPNTRANTPEHCHDCHNFATCHQAQRMTSDTEPVHGFTDTLNCVHVCADCVSDADAGNLYPLDFEELDSPAHCVDCGAPLMHALTSEGVAYVREAIAEGGGCCRELWPTVWADYLPADPYFDRFDVCEAYYLYARLNGEHETIARLNRMEFRPGLSLRSHDEPERALTENGQAIYYQLARRKADAR